MILSRSEIVEVARTTINTEFHAQGRKLGVGFDCIGVPIYVFKELGVPINDPTGYAPVPSNGSFLKEVSERCNRITFDEIKPGDMMIFSFLKEPQHIAIITEVKDKIKILHAYNQVNKVVEHDLDHIWKKRLKGCYRLKNVEFED